MYRMNPNGSTRSSQSDPKLLGGLLILMNVFDAFKKIADCNDKCNEVVFHLHLTATTGQGASRMTYWAVEPNTILPTFDLLLTPIMISSILLSFA